MKTTLEIGSADGKPFVLPPELVTQTTIVYGGKGMGKTNLIGVLAKPASAPVADEAAIQRAVKNAVREIERTRQDRERKFRAAVRTYKDRLGNIAKLAALNGVHLPEEAMPGPLTLPEPRKMADDPRRAPSPAHSVAPARGDETLPKGERIVLSAIAQYPDGATREQLTILTGYKRSSRDTYLQRLREKGLIVDGGKITATEAGIAALGEDFQPLPTGDALREYWLERLPEGERRVFEKVAAAYPNEIERDALGEATGYKRSSRDTYLQRLQARKLIKAERGMVRAADELFA